MKAKVHGWIEMDMGACPFYRMEQPFEAMAAQGWPVAASKWVRGDDLLRDEVDLVVAQRVADPNAIIILDALKQRGIPYLYETDDLLTAIDPENPVARFYNDPSIRLFIETAIVNSAGITVSTPELAEEMEQYERPVTVLPNCLPDYFGDLLFALGQEDVGERPTRIIWAGSATHHGDFHEEMRYGLRKALRGDAEFYCVGADYRHKLGGLGQHVPWSESIPAFHRTLPRYDIGLAPLQRTRFNECKSELKVIEYQAAGVVPVAQDIAPYRRAIEHGVNGFLCRTEHDWKRALETLVNEPDTLREMSVNCLTLTPGRLLSSNIERWAETYEAAAA